MRTTVFWTAIILTIAFYIMIAIFQPEKLQDTIIYGVIGFAGGVIVGVIEIWWQRRRTK